MHLKERVIHLSKLNSRPQRLVWLWVKQKGKCHYCKEKMLLHIRDVYKRKFATLDHIIPKTAGGTNKRENLLAACSRCNIMKGAMPYAVFMAMRSQHMNGQKSNITPSERRQMANNCISTTMEREIHEALEEQAKEIL